MKYVLITITGGIVNQVTFHENARFALANLSEYVKEMISDKEDAAVYGPEGLITNAKLFLDFKDFIENDPRESKIFIIANPYHDLGFLVTTLTEPIGFTDPIKALSVLEKMRREQGCTFWLYRVEIVKGSVAETMKLEKYNVDHGVNDFKYDLVREYLK